MKVLEQIAQERAGYRYGKPQRIDENLLSVVVPIFRETSINRSYITYTETDKVKVIDTGAIDVMLAENKADQNVFIRSGTIFRGSTQARALQRSAVLFPGKQAKLGVRCVHASHGIKPNATAFYGGITPLDVDKSNYTSGYTPKSQHEYWANVLSNTSKMSSMMGGKGMSAGKPMSRSRRIQSSGGAQSSASSPPWDDAEITFGSSTAMDSGIQGFMESSVDQTWYSGSGSDDLAGNFDKFAEHFDAVLSKIKYQENQAGLALITRAGVETIEFFDHTLSWKALHESAVKRLGSNALAPDEAAVFEYKPENAIRAVNKVLGIDWKENRIYRHESSNGEPDVTITGLTGEHYVGEVVEVNGAAIHVTILSTK